MGRDERSAAAKEKDRAEIARLYIQEGMTQTQIAARLRISQATVSRDLGALKKRWQREADKIVATAQGEIVARLMALYSEAMAQFRKSEGVAVTARGVVVDPAIPADPRYLGEAKQILHQYWRVMGLDKMQDGQLRLSPETLLLIHALGLDTSQVAAAFNEMIAAAARADVESAGTE